MNNTVRLAAYQIIAELLHGTSAFIQNLTYRCDQKDHTVIPAQPERVITYQQQPMSSLREMSETWLAWLCGSCGCVRLPLHSLAESNVGVPQDYESKTKLYHRNIVLYTWEISFYTSPMSFNPEPRSSKPHCEHYHVSSFHRSHSRRMLILSRLTFLRDAIAHADLSYREGKLPIEGHASAVSGCQSGRSDMHFPNALFHHQIHRSTDPQFQNFTAQFLQRARRRATEPCEATLLSNSPQTPGTKLARACPSIRIVPHEHRLIGFSGAPRNL
ncbi:hypothetical protein BJ546DRAFT_634664 [Cryomyces antarcticus]